MWERIGALTFIITASTLLFSSFDLEARGGGRGGGGGSKGGGAGGARGGGAYQGGNVTNRTPTMSRASSKPISQPRQQIQAQRPSPQGRIQQPQETFQKPLTSQMRVPQGQHNVQKKPSAVNRADLRNQVSRYAQNRPQQNINQQTLALKTQNFSSKRNSQITQNKQLSDRVSLRLRQSSPDSNHWFDQNFFDRHNSGIDYARTGVNWWRPAAWATLATWGSWDWSTPYYYDEGGYAYPITTTESAFVNPYDTAVIPYQPAQMQPMQSSQVSASTDENWLPLGVFTVANNAYAAAQSSRFIQLAINRSGEIAGVLYNSTVDTAQDLVGMVDPNNQMAYWSTTSRADAPIFSTGIYNLTEDQTTVNVHFSDGSDQTWTLVRLQQG